MTFNRNYLSAQSQPWAREVQKRVTNLESAFRSAEVNNTTRDDQLAASFRRLDATFLETQQAAADAQQASQDALDAVNRIVGLGSPGGDPVDGSNLVVGSVTATEISSSYVYTNTLSANQITSGSIDASVITVTNLDASNITTGSLTADRISGGTITASDISGVNISGVTISGSDFISGGNVEVPFGTVFGATVTGGSFLFADGILNSTGTYNRTISNAANLFVASNGNFARSTSASSREIKENIMPLNFDANTFLDIEPVTFNYKEGILTAEDDNPTLVGFIAEDFIDAGLDQHLVTPANEFEPTIGLRYDKLYMFLHKSVQEINERLKALENGTAN